MSEKARGLWAKVQPGDIVAFYATKTGVIGYGVVEGKFESSEPLWPKEREEGKAVWPYRLKIKVEKVFEKPKPEGVPHSLARRFLRPSPGSGAGFGSAGPQRRPAGLERLEREPSVPHPPLELPPQR